MGLIGWLMFDSIKHNNWHFAWSRNGGGLVTIIICVIYPLNQIIKANQSRLINRDIYNNEYRNELFKKCKTTVCIQLKLSYEHHDSFLGNHKVSWVNHKATANFKYQLWNNFEKGRSFKKVVRHSKAPKLKQFKVQCVALNSLILNRLNLIES